MIELKPMPGGIKIHYSPGDVFEFSLQAPRMFSSGSTVRLEISHTGGIPFFAKDYTPVRNHVDIKLSNVETANLAMARNYIFKLFFIKDNSVCEMLSGNIKIV